MSGMIKGTRDLGAELQQWHNGMDAIYQTGSHFYAGLEVTPKTANEALSLLERIHRGRAASKMPASHVKALNSVMKRLRRAIEESMLLPEGWRLAAGSCGMNIGDTRVFATHYKGVALFARKDTDLNGKERPDGSPAAWSVGVTGLMTSSGKNLYDAAEKAQAIVDRHEGHPGEYDRRISRAKFEEMMADPTRLYSEYHPKTRDNPSRKTGVRSRSNVPDAMLGVLEPHRPTKTAIAEAMKQIPKSEIDFLVGRYHVSEEPSVVEADMRKRAVRAKWPAAAIEASVQYAVKQHAANLQMYQDVMGGRIGSGKRR